MNNVLTLDDAQ